MKFLAHNEDNPAEAPGICLFQTSWVVNTKNIRKIQITVSVVHGFGYCFSYTFVS